MTADEIYKSAVILREWFESPSYQVVTGQIEALKTRYLNTIGLSEYGDATSANKIRALQDLTDSLQWIIDEEQRLIAESKEAASGPKTSAGRIAPRPAPHVL